MKDKRIFFLMMILALLTASAQAQDVRPIGLEEAINLSIRNSKQLRADSARVEQATAAWKQAVQRRLPDAKVSGSFLMLTNANVNLKAAKSGGGGDTTTSSVPHINQAAYGILNVSLPIYAGGRIRYGIESSKLLEKAAQLDVDNQREDVIENTVEAYINLYKAKQALDIVNANRAQQEVRVHQFERLEQQGLLARNDLLRVQLQASNTDLTLLDIRNNWELANINMDLMLGLPDTVRLQPDTNVIHRQFNAGMLDEYLQNALKNRKDVMALDVRRQAAATGVKATKAESSPSIGLTGGYVAADIPKLVTITNAANIGVGVSYDIGSLWKNKAKVQEAQARVKELEASQDQLNDAIRLQVTRAYLNWQTSQKKIDVNLQSVAQADENYRITDNKYRNSLATLSDVLDAQVSQLQAQLNYAFAQADAITAYHQLLQAAGQLSTATK